MGTSPTKEPFPKTLGLGVVALVLAALIMAGSYSLKVSWSTGNLLLAPAEKTPPAAIAVPAGEPAKLPPAASPEPAAGAR
jgi:hypothetical protein